MKYFVTLGGREIEVEVDGGQVTVDGERHEVHQSRIPGTPLRQLMIGGRALLVPLERAGPGRWTVTIWGERREAVVLDERARHIRDLVRQAEPEAKGGVIRAPMPGLVLRIEVAAGDTVAAGQGVLVLEAMKMENELKASAPGIVTAILVQAGVAVEKGQPLVQMGPPPGA
jgi:biotin carboxyl carrier protein